MRFYVADSMGCSSRKSVIGGQLQIRFLSPCALSTLPTGGQNLEDLTQGKGKAAFSLEYSYSQLSETNSSELWGAFFKTLFSRFQRRPWNRRPHV